VSINHKGHDRAQSEAHEQARSRQREQDQADYGLGAKRKIDYRSTEFRVPHHIASASAPVDCQVSWHSHKAKAVAHSRRHAAMRSAVRAQVHSRAVPSRTSLRGVSAPFTPPRAAN
jgi:hypothetical protein